jgi:hypothetical protein
MCQVIELMPGDGPGGFSRARTHTRSQPKADGLWEGWHHWTRGKLKSADFEVNLLTGGPCDG